METLTISNMQVTLTEQLIILQIECVNTKELRILKKKLQEKLKPLSKIVRSQANTIFLII